MADEVEKLAGNLGDLNKVTLQAGLEFKGFTKRLIEYSDATSKAGKKWTIFARLVSGSPLWRLQNKVRAIVDILGQIEQSSVQNAKAAQEQNQKVIDQVQAYETLAPRLERLDELMLMNTSSFQLATYMQSEQNKEVNEAIKGTLAYNVAILEGVEANEAYTKGLEELVEKGKQQKEVFKEAQKVAVFNKRIQTEEGRMKIRGDLEGERGELRKEGGFFKQLFDVSKLSLKSQNIGEKIAQKSLRMQVGLVEFTKMAKPIFNYLFKVLIMTMIGILAFMVLAKFIYDSFTILEELGVIDEILSVGKLVLDNVMLIFGMIGALLTGDVYTFMDYALQFVDNLLLIGIGLLKVIIGVAIGTLIGAAYTLLDLIGKFLFDEDFNILLFDILVSFGKVLLAAYVVKQIAIQMLTIAAIYAMPVLIGAVIIAGIAAVLRKIIGPLGKLPFFASGGVSSGGMAVVGEGGPELVSLPAGARVHNNAQSKNMMKSNTVNNHVNVTINAKDTSDAELRRIADQVGNMITNKINRSVSSSGFVR